MYTLIKKKKKCNSFTSNILYYFEQFYILNAKFNMRQYELRNLIKQILGVIRAKTLIQHGEVICSKAKKCIHSSIPGSSVLNA